MTTHGTGDGTPRPPSVLLVWCGLAVAGFTLLSTCRSDPARHFTVWDPALVRDVVGLPTPAHAEFQRGVCLAHSNALVGEVGYGSEASLEAKRELLEHNVEWISLTPFAYQSDLDSTEITIYPDGFVFGIGETDDKLVAEAKQARALGMSVMLKPHIWVGGGQWRGHIQPDPDAGGFEAWFASYRAFIVHYARVAAEIDADAFVVGLELASSSWTQRDRWLAIIDAVREVYNGPITYAANWNEAEKVTFWDRVDWIGVQMFAPLAEDPDEDEASMRARLRTHLDGYETLSERYGKPVVLTEYGFTATRYTNLYPATWPDRLPDEARIFDEEAQALGYKILLDEVGQREFIRGAYAWKWFTDSESDEEGHTGYSARGRMAAIVLKTAYARRSSGPSP